MSKVFLTAEWRNLILINYETDETILKKFIPAKTELESWNGKHLISLVGFQFINTKILGIKIPFHTHFEEVNLRFYVRRKTEGEWRRGVVFISEIVPRAAIAFVANTFYHERYRALPMDHHVSGCGSYEVEYRWKFRGEWNSVRVRTTSTAREILPGSEEEFITEHYWGYNKVSETKTTEYQVEHPRWKMFSVDDYKVNCDFVKLYGEEFSFLKTSTPVSVFLAEGSEVKVHKGFTI